MPLRYRARILDHLSHDDYRPAAAADVARQLRVALEDRPAFDEAVAMLASESLLEVGDDERLRLPRFGDVVEGRIKINVRGFGFVIPDTPTRDGDLFVPAGQTGDAISGDRVRCKVTRRSSGPGQRIGAGAGARKKGAPDRGTSGMRSGPDARPVGRVIEVVERASRRFAGTLDKQGRQWLVKPDGRRLRDIIMVRDPHAKGAKVGDKVVVEIIAFPSDLQPAEGVITEVLGESGRPDVETQAVIAAFDLPGAFLEPVLDDAREAARSFDASTSGPWPDRLDLTQELTFTIDPPDARDFDDAITITHNETRDEWTLGVHIADVSSFVAPGGELDREARERGNSVYLPRLVIPMLPEVLSNGVCSLQEGVPRFTKSAIISLDSRGRPGAVRLANSVIRSDKRLTYLEAQAYLDGRDTDARKHARTETDPPDGLVHALRLAGRLAKLIEKRRRTQGMISLELPQVELIFGDDGRVVDAAPEDDSFTHKLIEMFMVEANEAVARAFADLDVPLLRRIHPEPGFADLEELRTFARIAQVRLPEEPTRHDLQALLEATRHRDDTRAVHFAVLRTLSKASYSPALIGHYALASDHYAHFTSPIRRYPDLTVHRAIDSFLELTENGVSVPGGRKRRTLAGALHQDPRVMDEQALLVVGRHCSETEVRAEEAERDLRSFLVLQLLSEKHMADEFDAIVTGLFGTSGVFVSLERFLIDGVVRMEALATRGGERAARGEHSTRGGERRGPDRPERWSVDERSGRLVSVRSGASIGLGDKIRVAILSIDLASRTMELALAAPLKPRAEKKEGDDGALKRPTSGPGSRDPRRDMLPRGMRAEVEGKRRGFKQGRRSRRSG